MTPQVNLERSTIERMKAHAEPLVDTYDTIINRALDALDAKKEQASSRGVLNPASPPNLAYATLKSVVLNGKQFTPAKTHWNTLMVAAVHAAK